MRTNLTPIPYWLERLGIFTYKVLVWLFLGIVIGLFLALMQGFLSVWFLFVFVPGSIGLGWVFVLVYISYTDYKARLSASNPAGGSKDAAPALIEQVRHAGLRIMETRELMVVELTVFPTSGEPYQTTVRQLFKLDDLEQLSKGTVVTFYEDVHDTGYGMVSLGLPEGGGAEDLTAFRTGAVFPERRRTGLLLLVGRNPSIFARSVSMVLFLVVFGYGFLSPYIVTGNVDWLRLRITYFPQKLTFQYKGNFNPEAFRKAYDKAMECIGDRRVESLLFYKDFTNVRAEDHDKPGYISHVIIRGNSVEEGILSLTTAEEDRLFTVDAINFELFSKALDDAATEHDIEDIMYIGVRKGIRWGARDRHIRGSIQHHVDIHVVFEGGQESLHYHGETGERLPE